MRSALGLRVVYLGLQGGSSVLLLSALAHTLDKDAFAAVAVALGTAVVVQAVADLGLSNGVASVTSRRVAEGGGEKVLASAALMFLVASALAGGGMLAAAFVYDGQVRDATILLSPMAAAAVVLAGADAVLRVRGEFGAQVRLVAVARALPMLAVVVAIASQSSSSTAVAIAVLSVVGTWPALRLVRKSARGGTVSGMREVIQDCLPFGGAQLSIVGSARLNTVVMGTNSAAAAAAFEGAWRVFQAAQYLGGAAASAVGPLTSAALGRGERAAVRQTISRALIVLMPAGVVLGGLLLLAADQLGQWLFPAVASDASRAIVALAVATPFGLGGQVVLGVLGSLARERALLPWAFGLGTVTNLAFLASDTTAFGAAVGAAAGVTVANGLLLGRWLVTTRSWSGERGSPRPDGPPPASSAP